MWDTLFASRHKNDPPPGTSVVSNDPRDPREDVIAQYYTAFGGDTLLEPVSEKRRRISKKPTSDKQASTQETGNATCLQRRASDSRTPTNGSLLFSYVDAYAHATPSTVYLVVEIPIQVHGQDNCRCTSFQVCNPKLVSPLHTKKSCQLSTYRVEQVCAVQ